jgi:hypothetical protein
VVDDSTFSDPQGSAYQGSVHRGAARINRPAMCGRKARRTRGLRPHCRRHASKQFLALRDSVRLRSQVVGENISPGLGASGPSSSFPGDRPQEFPRLFGLPTLFRATGAPTPIAAGART